MQCLHMLNSLYAEGFACLHDLTHNGMLATHPSLLIPERGFHFDA